MASSETVDALVVGAGFAGSVVAERLASAGWSVLIVDRRDRIGGNAADHLDEHGVLVHRYGPHIFHTKGRQIVDYLSRFTDWRPYEHRVLASVNGMLVPMPVNRTTINRLYGTDYDEAGAQAFLDRVRVPRDPAVTSEDVVLHGVGPELCDLLYRGYTRKQWGLDLSELSAGVAARLPVRTNDDDRYFTDWFQSMPAEGYSALFARLLDHPNIEVRLGTDHEDVSGSVRYRKLVWTGAIDAYFGYRFGRLPYRSLSFRFEHKTVPQWQEAASVNYPNEHAYTRITEFKHMTGQSHPGTTIVYEYPEAEGDPYYPIPRPENAALYKRYQEAAAQCPDVTFVGRLAEYRYYNMD